jgi:hypothetical protein
MSEIFLVRLDFDQEGEDDKRLESRFVVPLPEKVRCPAPEIRQLFRLSRIGELRKLLEEKTRNLSALGFEGALSADLLGNSMLQLEIRLF